ncbi:hypothetical protein ACQJBY_008296 [Aegilops geniculata]
MAGAASEANKGEIHSVPVGHEANKEGMQPVAGGASVDEDNAWMQFISDGAWYTSAVVAEDNSWMQFTSDVALSANVDADKDGSFLRFIFDDAWYRSAADGQGTTEKSK